jgi:ankyrin repeat protein
MSRSPNEILQSVSDVMFPEDLGDRIVALDSVGCDGDTPLHVFAWRNDLEAVEILIAAGADVNAKGEMDETALHIAITQQNIPMIQALLKAGARDDIRCEFGDTPRERASEHGETFGRLFGKMDKT